MIVPTQKGPTGPSGEMPSEANLLMALSEMQKQGRFKVAGDVLDANSIFAAKRVTNSANSLSNLLTGKEQTQDTLRGVLGGPTGKVLPMTPKDKD